MKDHGRTGTPGNKRGTPGKIHIGGMKNPNIHLKGKAKNLPRKKGY